MYKKRSGTSGISGQLYETKLISLILFRLLHDDRVEDFHLASNMDDIGAFDDVCFKIKITEHDRPIICLMQVKHKENDDKYLTLDNTNDLVKWSNSITKIKQMFGSKNSKNKIFNEEFDKTECMFILYTNAKYDVNSIDEYVSKFASPLNDLLATGGNRGFMPRYTEKDVEDFSGRLLNDEIKVLVDHFTKYLNGSSNQSMNIMNDELMTRYHVILASNVVNVSEIQFEEQKPDKWRLLTFRHEFFDSDNNIYAYFKKCLFEQVVKNQGKIKKTTETEQDSSTPAEELISAFLSGPSAVTLSPLIETHITYKIGKLMFLSDRPEIDTKVLEQINMSPFTVDEAKAIAAKNVLLPLKLKVPVAFGNMDLAIRGNSKKIEKQLVYLTEVMDDLCHKSKPSGPYNIITIDETIDEGILSSNGRLGGTVGNILIYDDTTKLLKFTNDETSLQSNAKALFFKLKDKINNLHEYRFDVKTVKFPTLSLDCSNIARDFLSKLIIYAKQGNHYEVEEKLKEAINKNKSIATHNITVKTDSIYLYFHNEIQKWWMAPKTGPYLTKLSDMYKQALNNIVVEPQISALQNSFNITNMNYFKYQFNDNATNKLRFIKDYSKIIVTTRSSILTTIKMIQSLRNNDNKKYAVLDLASVINLSSEEFKTMTAELEKTKKVIIIICENIPNARVVYKRLKALSGAVEKKKVVVVTNKMLSEVLQEYFPDVEIMNDEIQSLVDLTPESQKEIIQNTVVLFQGEQISLDLLVDDMTVTFITGAVLNKVLNHENIILGESLTNSIYEEMKHLYIERTISRKVNIDSIDTDKSDNYSRDGHIHYNGRTFYDVKDDVVLMTAKPGMGKSTLLTHLALKTKESNKQIWILKLNLLDYSKEFYNWQKSKIVMNTLETLKFMCQVIIKNFDMTINLKEINDEVYLDGCTGDEWATFELNMFLHCYNKRKLILVFDGFDEISPHYKDNVIEFFNVIRNYPKKCKMWVTSRPYCDIIQDLTNTLGKSYDMKCLNNTEQKLYLLKFWQAKLKFGDLNEIQINHFISFLISKKYMALSFDFRLRRIYYHFYHFVLSYFPYIDVDTCDTDTSINTETFFDEIIDRLDLPEPTNVNDKNERIDDLIGTPLLLQLIADYFIHIVDTGEEKWDRDINILTLYETLVEAKIKKIVFQEKNKMDVYNPDIITKYEKEYKYCNDIHKKMAAYALLGSPIFTKQLCFLNEFDKFRPFDEDTKELESMINTIKIGKEKTGLISYVTDDNVPVFIHRTFTEYFTAEYLCDLLKSNKYELHIKNCLFKAFSIWSGFTDVQHWISRKSAVDSQLDGVIQEIQNKSSINLFWYREFFNRGSSRLQNLSIEQRIRLMASSVQDYEDNCFDEYNSAFISKLFILGVNERDQLFKECIDNIIGKMKIHLKKYFDPPPRDDTWPSAF